MADPIIKIHSLDYPSTVIENTAFEIKISARNDGDAGLGYVKIRDLRTMDWILYEDTLSFGVGEIKQFTIQYSIPQTTPFIARTGHIKFGEHYNDDGIDFTIVAVSAECEDYMTQGECEYHDCYWYNGSCHTNHPTCEELNNQSDCERYGCEWYEGACHTSITECEDYINQAECEAADCYWWNNSCHDNPSTCEELNNQAECLAYNCYWYDESCHTVPSPCEEYLTQAECEANNCYWYDNSCHTNPEIPIPIVPVLIGAGVVAVAIGFLIKKRMKK